MRAKNDKTMVDRPFVHLSNMLVGFLYAWFFDFIYVHYIVDLFGVTYVPMHISQRFFCFFIASAPLFFFEGMRHFASVFSIFQYVFVYVPFIETLSFGGWGTAYDDYKFVFFSCMCLCFLTDGLSLFSDVFKHKSQISFRTFKLISFSVLLLVVLINVRNLQFTNFLVNRSDLYDIRETLRGKIVGGGLVVYILFWMKCVVLPILLAHSLVKGDILETVLSLLGSVLMFMLDQQKLTFIMPIVSIGAFYLMSASRNLYQRNFHVLMMSSLSIFSFFLYRLKDVSNLLYELAALVIYRTQCIEGLLLNTYLNFFGHDGVLNPYTYYSHIKIINSFTGNYPYNTSLGRAVTYNVANANGCSWLMDGVAAAGLWGVVVSTILFIVMKSLFNGASLKMNLPIFSVISIFAMSMLINVSLFTALFSCGFILLYLLLVFVDFSDLNMSKNS